MEEILQTAVLPVNDTVQTALDASVIDSDVEKVLKRSSGAQQAEIIRLHDEEKSRRQIAKILCVSAKTVQKVLEGAGVPAESTKRGRKSALTSREEDALVNFLLSLDKVNLNWTWPLLHKLLEIIARKRDAGGSGSSRMFSSKWLVGFTHRHRKRIALRVVDYGLSGGLQSKQKTHPGRMDTFEHILRTLYTDLHLPVSHENLLEVQDMWVHHVESPKTRKVFALKGRKNVRLTIGIAVGGGGRKKRVRRPKLPDSAMLMGAGQPVPVMCAPQVNETAVRVALHAIMRGGYTEEDAKKILRDINVPIL